MKIKFKVRKAVPQLVFSDLSAGQVFKVANIYSDDETPDVYMKVYDSLGKIGSSNAVCLDTGTMYRVDADEEVELIQGSFVEE